MKTITITNQKGGVGKSTTAAALGAGLQRKGFKVLYIDLDAQGNLSYALGADSTGLTGNNTLGLLQGIAASNSIHQTRQGDIIPSSPGLIGADATLAATGKEYRLKEALEPISEQYDYAIIDTPPALGILTINALTAANGIVIPAQADIFSLQGIAQLYRTIQTVQKYTNPNLRVLGILLTRYNARTIISREIADMLDKTARQLNTKLYSAKIRENTAVKEAQAEQQNIYEYAPRSNAAADYIEFVDEFLERGE